MKNVLILGGIIIDKYKMIESYPKHGTDTFINEAFDIPGGCSLNVAVTLKNLGCNPYIFSKIGSDSESETIESYLQSKGLETKFVERVQGPTDYCLVMVDALGERTFFTHDKLDREISKEMMENILSLDYKSVYVTGYFMVNTDISSRKLDLLKALSQKGVLILFDPGAIVSEIQEDLLKELLSISDILTPNKFEVDEMVKRLKMPLDKVVKESSYLIEKDGGNDLLIKQGQSVQSMTPFKSDVVDTTGAGDSFAGGLLCGFANNKDIEGAVQMAMACGSITTTFKEPHASFEMKDIEKIIETGRNKNDK